MSRRFVPVEKQQLVWREGMPFYPQGIPVFSSAELALNPSDNLFIQGNRLLSRWQKPDFVIADTCFGTGLNALLTWHDWLQYAPKDACLQYFSCTSTPFDREDLARILALMPQLSSVATELLDAYPTLTPGFHQLNLFAGRIRFTLMLGKPLDCLQALLFSGDEVLESCLQTRAVDAWYLHGDDEDLARNEFCQILALLSANSASLVSPLTDTSLPARLQAAGFVVQSSAEGFLIAELNRPLNSMRKRTTPWFLPQAHRVNSKKALILGGGLAGCVTANALARRGWHVLICEAAPTLAAGASANPQAVLFPNLSACSSPLSEVMTSAYLYAHQYYKHLLTRSPLGELRGALQLAYNEKEAAEHAKLHDWLKAYPELGQPVSANEASALAGVTVTSPAVYLPLSGWLDIKALCEFLVKHPGIECVFNQPVSRLIYEEGQWQAGGVSAEVLVLANGFAANQFEQTCHLPLVPQAGQLSMIASQPATLSLQLPLCADGHILPARDGKHLFGATWHPGVVSRQAREADDKLNLEKLAKFPTGTRWSDQLIGHWAATRAATPDYLPLLGPVPDAQAFFSQYASLALDSKRWLPQAAPCYPGLYLCAGFGARGLTSIPLCGEWLASLIHGEMNFLPARFVKYVSPARFLFKQITKKRDHNWRECK